MELFLFLVSLFQNFTFSVPGDAELNEEGVTGTTRVPHPFEIHARPR